MNFDARKHILEYDDVMNKHRDVFYKRRREVLGKGERNDLRNDFIEIIKKAGHTEKEYEDKEKEIGEKNMREVEKYIYLKALDTLWIEHLENMEYLRDSVGLRAYGQQDPLVEYKKEGHRMFRQLLDNVDNLIASAVFQAGIKKQEEKPAYVVSQNKKAEVGRNDPCPCGSGKKYKKCCGK